MFFFKDIYRYHLANDKLLWERGSSLRPLPLCRAGWHLAMARGQECLWKGMCYLLVTIYLSPSICHRLQPPLVTLYLSPSTLLGNVCFWMFSYDIPFVLQSPWLYDSVTVSPVLCWYIYIYNTNNLKLVIYLRLATSPICSSSTSQSEHCDRHPTGCTQGISPPVRWLSKRLLNTYLFKRAFYSWTLTDVFRIYVFIILSCF